MPATLTEGLGLAMCDDLYYVTIIDPPRRGKPLTEGATPKVLPSPPRESSGKRHPNESATNLVNRILGRAQRLPKSVGVSYHDADILDGVEGIDTELVHIFPTVATLAGLGVWHDRRQTLIQPGSSHTTGRPSAIIKIGPRKLTWAVEGDPTAPPNYISSDIVGGLSERTAALYDFIGAPDNTDPIELLGNRGWRNAATYLAQTNPSLMTRPNRLTAELLRDLPPTRPGARTFTSHLASAAMTGDPFAQQVASQMTELLGLIIGYVSQQASIGRLYVQYNAVTAVDGMPEWVVRNAKSALKTGLRIQGGSGSEIIMIGPKPQVAEAYGASQLAGKLVAA